MYSTQKNITDIVPQTSEDTVTCRYIKYPDNTSKRQAEGGLRLRNKYKNSIEKKPLVSVITVCFNSEKYLERCILSVLNQSYDNIEYIIIDGASTDNTLNIIKKYEHAIDYYVSEPDCGIYYAMNKGLELASGDYIAMLNSDDWYLESSLKTVIDNVLLDNSDCFIGNHKYIKYDGSSYDLGKVDKNKITYTSVFNYMLVNHQALFVCKKCYNNVGFYDTKYKIASDYKLKSLLVINNFKFIAIDDVIVNCQYGGYSTDVKYRDKIFEEFYDILIEITEIKNRDDVRSLLLFVSDSIITSDFEKKLLELQKKEILDDVVVYELLYKLYRTLYYNNATNIQYSKNEDGIDNKQIERKRTFLEYIFSVYTEEKFVVVYLFGIKISVKRKGNSL